jgi:hypothetical protein
VSIIPKAAWCSGSTLGSYYMLMEPSGPRIETESRYFIFCSVFHRSFYRHLLLTLSDSPAPPAGSPGHCDLKGRRPFRSSDVLYQHRQSLLGTVVCSKLLAMLSTWGLRTAVLAIYLGSAYLVNVEVTEPYLVSRCIRCGISTVLTDKM